MACLTESGRIIDNSGLWPKELIDGVWVSPVKPLYGEEVMSARVLSDEELAAYIEKSGKAN